MCKTSADFNQQRRLNHFRLLPLQLCMVTQGSWIVLRFVAELARVVVIQFHEFQSESNNFGPLLGLLRGAFFSARK